VRLCVSKAISLSFTIQTNRWFLWDSVRLPTHETCHPGKLLKQVDTTGSTVTLRGKVRTYAERDEAERVAWAAPGVFSVDDLAPLGRH
jgi:hypothetical protein